MIHKITTLITIILMLAVSAPLQAQDDAKKKSIQIKKNSEYIYGEAAGEDEDVCYEIAREKLMEKIKKHLQENGGETNIDAFIIENLQSKTHKLTYERTLQIKVVCLYVHKNDIIPIYSVDEKKETDTTVKIIETADTAKRTKESTAEEKKEEPLKETPIEIIAEENPVNPVKAETNIETAKKIKTDNPTYTAREKEILDNILGMSNYKEIQQYLDKEKNTSYDIKYRLVKKDDVKDCFWLIFNASQELIAAFDKELKNIMSTETKTWEDYAKYPKMWIIIYK